MLISQRRRCFSPVRYLLILVFRCGCVLPAGGWNGFELRFFLVPVALLTFINVATIGRMMRGSFDQCTAISFAPQSQACRCEIVVLRHALRPAAAGRVGEGRCRSRRRW
jgi:oligopeptide transport system permease protein